MQFSWSFPASSPTIPGIFLKFSWNFPGISLDWTGLNWTGLGWYNCCSTPSPLNRLCRISSQRGWHSRCLWGAAVQPVSGVGGGLRCVRWRLVYPALLHRGGGMIKPGVCLKSKFSSRVASRLSLSWHQSCIVFVMFRIMPSVTYVMQQDLTYFKYNFKYLYHATRPIQL